MVVFEFSQEEYQSGRDAFSDLLDRDFSESDYELLKDSPYQFLKQNGFEFVDRMEINIDLINEFDYAVKTKIKIPVFSLLRRNKCFLCKLFVMAIIYAFLATMGIPWDQVLIKVDGLLGVLDKFFNETEGKVDKFLQWLKKQIAKFRPEDVALESCREFGFCQRKL